ncbi:MAG: hypothetical protein ABIP17_12470, partial [Ilumatobacteraceae bacterium]
MSPLAWTVLLSAAGVGGVLLAVTGWVQPAPSLGRVLDHLQRAGSSTSGSSAAPPPSSRLVSTIVRAVTSYPRILPSASDLRVAGRTLEQHVVWMVMAAVIGLVVPPFVIGSLQSLGVMGLGWYLPAIAAIGFAVVGPFIVHTTLIESVQTTRADFRYQTSAYLDVVTMLLAGNTGYEGALEQAAHAGDGRLFLELRRRMRESGARGSSLTDALQR